MRILLVEDDPMIGDSLRQGLRGEGFTVDWVQDGPSVERALDFVTEGSETSYLVYEADRPGHLVLVLSVEKENHRGLV